MDERDYKAMNEELNPPLKKPAVSGSSLTDVIYGVGIFLMIVIMIFGAVVWSLGY